MTSEVLHYHDQRQANGVYHLKILVPSIAAGAIIGKRGETIFQLQEETGVKVKMSKATDFYPGTTERVCLITGSFEGILTLHEFIMNKIKERPDPNAKMAVDFDHKQHVEREKQIKILVPNSTASMIIGKGGSYIKQIKEESGAYVQISQKNKESHALAERCITVIGEIENNKIACHMILEKIIEDPNSSNFLNVSYSDATGPIPNFNPTGSPFASPGNIPNDATNNGNTSYISNACLNSLNPLVTNNFVNPHPGSTGVVPTVPTGSGVVPFTGIGIGGSAIHPTNATHVIETIKTMLRGNGYSEQAISEISAAMNVLANYRMLGLNLAILNGINGEPLFSGIKIEMPSSAATCSMPQGDIANQVMHTSVTNMPSMGAACNPVPTSDALEAGSNMFGPVDSLEKEMSGLGLERDFTTSQIISRLEASVLAQIQPAMFESFHETSPALASPKTTDLPLNNNSFGLGTILGSGPPGDRQIGDETKIEMEVGENIVGAILGPEGKALVDIQRFSGANIQISKKGVFAPGTRNRIVTISGCYNAVNTAQHLIQRQIAQEEANRAQQIAMRIR